MPEVRDETGKVVANQPYDAAGEEAAKKMVAENAGYSITDARNRSGVNHAGDGSVGFNSIGVPMYKEGGEVIPEAPVEEAASEEAPIVVKEEKEEEE